MHAIRLLLLAAPMILACNGGERSVTGQCPAGEVCSPQTPNGLQFVGASFSDILFIAGPSPTAIGGTQHVQLEYDPVPGGGYIPLDLPFHADDDGGNGVKVETIQGSVVVVQGVASRSNYLRITDAATGELFDRKTLAAAAIDSISLVALSDDTIPPNVPIGFAAGQVEAAIALHGAVQESEGPVSERLVDESMTLAAAGGRQRKWDLIDFGDAGAGVYPMSVTAGNHPPAQVDVAVYDHLDSLTPQADNPATIVPNRAESICFDPMAAGHFVSGATFHFAVTGVGTMWFAGGNCVLLSTEHSDGQVSIVASAMDATATATIPIGAARVSERVRAVAVQDLPSPAGDRAAL